MDSFILGERNSKVFTLTTNSIDDDVIIKLDTESINWANSNIKISCDEISYEKCEKLTDINSFEIKINNPRLWYPNGYGEPYLYTFKFIIFNEFNNNSDSFQI